MDDLDRSIINYLQRGLPLVEHPFAVVASELACSEVALLERLKALLNEGILSRFGPMFDADALGGAFTLAAMKVPEEHFDEVAEQVNAFEQVAHNYERDHQLNMWFVIATETREEITSVITAIERITGLSVYNMPKLQEFYVGLYLPA